MNADRPKIKFIVLSVLKAGNRGVVRGDVGFEVGSIGWGVLALLVYQWGIADFTEAGARILRRVWRNMVS